MEHNEHEEPQGTLSPEVRVFTLCPLFLCGLCDQKNFNPGEVEHNEHKEPQYNVLI